MSDLIVVAGALIVDAKLLVAQRIRPPALAGLWELPGGKAAVGESDEQALARELHEELGIDVVVGARLGVDVALPMGTLRAYLVSDGFRVSVAHDGESGVRSALATPS